MKGSPLRLGQAGLVRVCRSTVTPHPLPSTFTPNALLSLLPRSQAGPTSPSGTGAAGTTGRSGPERGEARVLPLGTQAKLGSCGKLGGDRNQRVWGSFPKICQQKVSTSFCQAFQGFWGCSDSPAGLAGAASLCGAVAAMDPPSWEATGSIPGWRQDG